MWRTHTAMVSTQTRLGQIATYPRDDYQEIDIETHRLLSKRAISPKTVHTWAALHKNKASVWAHLAAFKEQSGHLVLDGYNFSFALTSKQRIQSVQGQMSTEKFFGTPEAQGPTPQHQIPGALHTNQSFEQVRKIPWRPHL